MEKRFVEPPEISVNKKICSQCGLCGRICPTRIFNSAKGMLPETRHLHECVLCGQCLCACPTGAIVHSGFEMANFKRIKNREFLTSEAVCEYLSQRRSVRNYTRETPSIELLEKILQVAGYAPGSPHHRIGWVRNMTVVQGADNMRKVLDFTAEYIQKIHKLLSGWMIKMAARYSDSAKAGIAVIPDMEMRLNEYKNGHDLITYHAPAAIFLHAPLMSSTPQTDCDTAALMIQLHAVANGLGTCWNGLIQGAAAGDHLRGFNKLSEFLAIPKGSKCYAAMTIGYPSIALHSLPERAVNITWLK